MRGLTKIPWISLTLLSLTYFMFGWEYSQWYTELIAKKQLWSYTIEPEISMVILYTVGVMCVLSILSSFTYIIPLINYSVSKWLKSDMKALIIILLGALSFTFIVLRVDYFFKFLVLLTTVILVKLDLQARGYSKWSYRLILIIFCLAAFAIGAVVYHS